MQVLSLGNFEGFGWDGSITDENHIADALEELGHEVTRMQRDQIRVFNKRYDFILISQWDGYPPNLATTLKTCSMGSPLVYWAFDYQADGQAWHERLVAHSDLYLSKRIADSRYPNWRWLSQDFAPQFLDKWEEPISVEKYEQLPLPKDIDVLFTGSYLDWATERNETLKAIDEKFNLVIHSVNEWPKEWNLDVRPPVMDYGLPGLYARAKIILSIDHTLEAGYWSDRNAQIIACGRRPLFRYIPLSEARFGDRVDYFYSIEDCLKKIAKQLVEPERPTDAEGLFVKDRVKDLLTIVRRIL